MDILNICSWLPAQALSLERIEEIVLSLNSGIPNESGYSLEMKMPINANNNAVNCTEDFISEGDKVCYLLKGGVIIATIGYK